MRIPVTSPPASDRPLRHRLRGWIRPRSAGVRVSRDAYRWIARGNAARARGDWPGAAAAYREALARMPALQHIWIQLAHALKEAGDAPAACAAYARAHALDPAGVEPLLRLAHLANDMGEPIAAARHLVALLQRAPEHLEAAAELVRLLPDSRQEPTLWHDALACLGVDPVLAASAAAAARPIAPGTLLVDVSDLLSYFGRARLPTGIQRVQIEAALAWLGAAGGSEAVLCSYATGLGWIALPDAAMARVCRASLISDDVADPAWGKEVRTLHALIAGAHPVRFARDCVLVNLGPYVADASYLAAVGQARRTAGLAYVPFIHDLIPLLHPEWFVPTLARDFRGWLGRLLVAADGYLANSESTRADLIAAAAQAGTPIAPPAARVVRIDGDFRAPGGEPGRAASAAAVLAARGLVARGFVLMVSTIEPRKNHLGAFGAWLQLADTLGEARVPHLVCVGGTGWLNEPVHAMLRAQPLLRRKAMLLSGVDDGELALLYDACRFTLYPSHYEGWGLPVSESLCHGRVPAVSRTSSLPEAGGDFAVYFDPADAADIAARITPLIVDDAVLAAAEARIRDGYRARSWQTIARQIAADANDIAARSRATPRRPEARG